MWYVYIVRCKDKSLYTGITTDIARRVSEHNKGKGGACTRVRRPVKLLYQEQYLTRSEALKREYQIKQCTCAEKLALTKLKILDKKT
ncbi:MAG: GIY-YIG nuclease family protein [Candidatus Orphnella occulta]|nr:GIY-YIG nuclease family protein [Candidatus Orphnella occulta]